MSRTPQGRTLSDIFFVPILIGVLSLLGLVCALVGDGIPDIIAWAGLAAPVMAIGWAWSRRTPKTPPEEK